MGDLQSRWKGFAEFGETLLAVANPQKHAAVEQAFQLLQGTLDEAAARDSTGGSQKEGSVSAGGQPQTLAQPPAPNGAVGGAAAPPAQRQHPDMRERPESQAAPAPAEQTEDDLDAAMLSLDDAEADFKGIDDLFSDDDDCDPKAWKEKAQEKMRAAKEASLRCAASARGSLGVVKKASKA